MKSLELNLNKRLLIIESEEEANEFFMMDSMKNGMYRLICKGSELTEEIAKEFSLIVRNSHNEQGFIDYQCEKEEIVYDPGFITAIHSFKSAIESKGYHWGENPEERMRHDMYTTAWEESEKKTFRSEKTLICEIL